MISLKPLIQNSVNYLDTQKTAVILVVFAKLSSFLRNFKQYYESASLFELIRDAIFIFVLCRILALIESYVLLYGVFGALREASKSPLKLLANRVMRLPGVRQFVDNKISSALAGVERELIERKPHIPVLDKLPEKGMSVASIDDIVNKLQELKHADWEGGRISGAVYHGGRELLELQTHVYGAFTVANQLHPDCFPEVRHMEAEVVSMVLDLYNAPIGSCGTSTSGGTESLLLACLSAREKGYNERGIKNPEIIAPITVHAGINKAAYYFKMKLIQAPISKETGQVDLRAVERMINPNTVLLVGSAPNYPHGIIDNIEGLSDLALKYRLPLHVDACLGSFVVPFLEELGRDVPKFDFRVPGVTSISCDTHKYGFAPKGSSIIMYRSPDLRRYQYFVCTEWTGGVYASPTLAGSRPGALMAGCWASLLYVGRDGYRESARTICEAIDKLRNALLQDPVLSSTMSIIGDPKGSVLAFTSRVINIYDLGDRMKEKGWHLATLQSPAAIHVAATRLTLPVMGDLIRDLRLCTEHLMTTGSTVTGKDTKALYGVAGSISTSNVAERIAAGFSDILYKL